MTVQNPSAAHAHANPANGTTAAGEKPQHHGGTSYPPLSQLVRVDQGEEGTYTSSLHTLVSVPGHGILSPILGATKTSSRAYTSVQVSASEDIELNSDLVFANHSCDPSVVFDVGEMVVRAGPAGLKEGDEVTFFYPSTEWDMARPFDCGCGSSKCLGTVSGAKVLGREGVKKGGWWVNGHIADLLEEEEK